MSKKLLTPDRRCRYCVAHGGKDERLPEAPNFEVQGFPSDDDMFCSPCRTEGIIMLSTQNADYASFHKDSIPH